MLSLAAYSDGCAVGCYFVHNATNIAGVKAEGNYGVGAFFGGSVLQTGEGVFAAVAEQCGVAFNLATKDGPEAGTNVTEHIAAAYDQAKHLAICLYDFVTRQVIGGYYDDVAVVVHMISPLLLQLLDRAVLAVQIGNIAGNVNVFDRHAVSGLETADVIHRFIPIGLVARQSPSTSKDTHRIDHDTITTVTDARLVDDLPIRPKRLDAATMEDAGYFAGECFGRYVWEL